MELQYIHLAIAVGIGILIGYLFAKTLVGDLIYQERKDATKQSRKVILGEVNEKIAPMLPGFPYNYKDLVFIGKGIDYLVFDGLAEGHLKKIIFLELKS
jgi:predicted Holliday junction resolvase-like endonuclease